MAILLALLFGCSDHPERKIAWEVAGLRINDATKVVQEVSECCSFTGDGYSIYIIELNEEPGSRKCHYYGELLSAPFYIPAAEPYLDAEAICAYSQYDDGELKQVIIQNNLAVVAHFYN